MQTRTGLAVVIILGLMLMLAPLTVSADTSPVATPTLISPLATPTPTATEPWFQPPGTGTPYPLAVRLISFTARTGQ